MNSQLRILIIQGDTRRNLELNQALSEMRISCQAALDANEGWRLFASFRPTHVLCALNCKDAPGAEFFLRKLNNEFIGTPPEIYVCCSAEELRQAPPLDPAAFIIWPIARPVLEGIFSNRLALADTPGRQIARLRELYGLTLLGPDLIRDLDFIASRTTLAFQVSNCIIWGPQEEAHWPRSTQRMTAEQWQYTRNKCELALRAQTTILVSDGPPSETVYQGPGRSIIAAPMGPSGEDPIAGIALLCSDARCLSSEARDSLRSMSRRLSTELAWMSAHNRLADEHEKLRQTALLDPLLGVWTRTALQQAVNNQISSERRHGTRFAILMLDYKDLRSVNDRFGHLIGDQVMAHFAHVVSSSLRPQDQLGRFGGDELAALLVGVDLEEANQIAANTIDALTRNPFIRGDIEVELEVYAGITVIEESENGGDAGFARAQMAVDAAKSKRLSQDAVDGGHSKALMRSTAGGLLSAGSTLAGMYRILHEISRGAMGVVYRGEDLGLGRPVAIKLLRSDLSSDEALVAKFRSEAALLASLRHRNLVQVFAFGSDGDAVYFVMELVEGEPLSHIVRRLAKNGHYIELEAVAKIVEEIADALDAIHSLGIVHRDVKPENVLIDRINDRAVLVDVGIAKKEGDVRDAAGTPGFAAPESFMAEDESPPTDVYGLAATTYAMLTASAPYSGKSISEVVNRQLNEAVRLPTRFRSDLSTAVDSVLNTALAADSKQRYRSAKAFAIAINRALQKSPSAKTTPPSTRRLPSPTRPPTLRESPISTYRVHNPMQQGNTQNTRLTRGLVFLAAADVLEGQLGPQWLQTLSGDAGNTRSISDPAVSEIVKPTTPPDSWHETSHLLWILNQIEKHTDSPTEFIRELGAVVADASVVRYFGADPTAQAPGSLLKKVESFWRRYHNWGNLQVHNTSKNEAIIVLEDSPADFLFCTFLSGLMRQVPVLAQALAPSCTINSCEGRGDQHCSFTVTWAQPRSPAS